MITTVKIHGRVCLVHFLGFPFPLRNCSGTRSKNAYTCRIGS
ncbi:hypothetical protein SLEP1_g39998 [Rubroshorea leprosula]|uniref:Uncharacterized protein n=1 Tax=Rubroshorea leprosula TaxID=152421 RepID=A0AAV5L222_9ROSI|nr:hypothetical protein SLEP1_g39998 [Rubroshorea leprosula]